MTYPEREVTVINVGAVPGSDAFLVLTEQACILVDSGFAFCADTMTAQIKQELQGRKLDICLLTHSHYDHASGCAYLREAFPGVKIAASAYAAGVFKRPTAVSAMRELNLAAAKEYGVCGIDDLFENRLEQMDIDLVVGEGDVISVGTETLKVLAAPGHTKCSIAFYMPETRLLIACETMGVYVGHGEVVPCYLVGYEMSMRFMRRMKTLNPGRILIPHYGVVTGAECKTFLEQAIRCAKELRDWIAGEYARGYDCETIAVRYREKFYTAKVKRIQPLKAFERNAGHMISMVIKECGAPLADG